MDMTVNNASRRSMTSGDCASLLRKIDAFADKFGFNGTEKLLAGEGVNALRTASETTAAAVASGSVDIDALESPTVNAADSAALNASLLEKLTSAPPARTSVMFNLYAIMELMQEVAQELRDAMRELRQAELEGIQANILAQAGAQETAAWWQLGIGLGFSVAQAVITGVGMFKQLQSNTQAHEAVATKEKPLDAIKKEKARLEKIDSGKGSEVDNEVTAVLQGMPNERRSQLLQSRPVKASQIKSSMLTFNQETDDITWYNENKGQIWRAVHPNVEMPEDFKKFTPEEISRANPDLQVQMKELNQKYVNPNTHNRNKATAWNGYKELTKRGGAVPNEDNWKFSDEDMAAVDRVVCNICNDDIETIGRSSDEIEVIRWLQVKSVASDNRPQALDMYKSDLAERLQRAQAAVDNAPQNLEAARMMMKSAIWTQFGQLLGSIGQTGSQTASQLIGLDATRLQAIEKGMEERLDQNKDLFSDVMSLIEEVIRIYGEVTRAENQSLRDIMA